MTLATLPSTEYSIYFLSSIYCIILIRLVYFSIRTALKKAQVFDRNEQIVDEKMFSERSGV